MKATLSVHTGDNAMIELWNEEGKYLFAVIHSDFFDDAFFTQELMEAGEITVEIKAV